MADPSTLFRITPVDRGFRLEFDVGVARGERQRKRATFGRFTLDCDESAQVGGDDSAPPPLAFFASSIAF